MKDLKREFFKLSKRITGSMFMNRKSNPSAAAPADFWEDHEENGSENFAEEAYNAKRAKISRNEPTACYRRQERIAVMTRLSAEDI